MFTRSRLRGVRQTFGATCAVTLAIFASSRARAEAPIATPLTPVAPASAPQPHPVVDERHELVKLESLLHRLADEGRGYRTYGALAALASGAATLPAGIVMARQDERSLYPFVIGLGAGELVGGILILAWNPDPFAHLQRSFDERKAAGMAPDKIVLETEREWRDEAKHTRLARKVVGGIATVVGGASLGLGAWLAFSNSALSNLTPPERRGFATAFLGLGYLSAIVGLQTYFFETPIESSYQTYSQLVASPAITGSRARVSPRIGFAPLPGGGSIALVGSF
ncbi:MAG: hypothetical protein NVS3B20_06200 [Polyangiales bacterium]